MCGILIAQRTDYARLRLDAARDRMRERGPDSEGARFEAGTIYLGHRRLKVIDPMPRSDQPFERGPLSLVFNGEIYNYRELIREHRLETTTQSDTEVLLCMYERYGADCLKYLNGMFAFAIWNEQSQDLFVARDRLGIKPLFWTPGGLYASEIAPLLELEGHHKPDPTGVRLYKKLRMTVRGHTLYEGVSVFPAGHYAVNGELHRYWDLDLRAKPAPEDDELAALIEDSVALRSRADVPVGSYLSGGLDSTIITALLRPTDTWTVGFRELNEFEFGRLAARHLGTEHHEVTLEPDEFKQLARDLVAARCEPLCVPNEVLLFRMTQEVAQRNTVVLSGEGADELFFGYDRIFRWARACEYSDLDPAEFDRHYAYGTDPDIEILEYALGALPLGSALEQTAYFMQCFHLHGLLRRLDFATMQCSVEARVPFVDHRLVERIAGTPFEWRIADTPKAPLRRVFGGRIPHDITARPKVGFPVPLESLALAPGRTPYDQWCAFNLQLLGGEHARYA